MEIFNEILKKNKVKSNIVDKVNIVVNDINNILKENNINAKAMLGGSVAKDTYLKDFDCDVFVMFNLTYQDKPISDILETILVKYKPQRVHGSRDYFQFEHTNMSYEIVPVLDIKEVKNIVNVTDMSPFHVGWVTKHNTKYSDDIRLAKIFFKANDLYGAESYINGFSGYVLEILIIKYKGFLNLLKAASQWKIKEIIDIENFYNGKNPLKLLNAAKINSPLVIIDPVQKERNAAAALNIDKYSKLILLSKLFLESPNKDFFKKEETDINALKKEAEKNDCVFNLLTIKVLEGKRDVVGSKIVKIMQLAKKQIKLYGFNVFDLGFLWDEGKEAKVWLTTYPKTLPKIKKQMGPKVYSHDKNIFDFIEKHEEITLEGYTIYALSKRKYLNTKSLLKDLIKEDYIKDKANKIILS